MIELDKIKPYEKNAKKQRAKELYLINRDDKIKYVKEYRRVNAEAIKL